MKKIIISLLIISVSTNFMQAQEIDSVLTFKKAVQLALRNNLDLNIERNNLIERKLFRTYNFASLGPEASINASAYRSNGNSFIQQEGKVVNATVDGLQAGLNISQPIFGGFSRLSFARGAQQFMDAKMEQVNRTSQDVINTVATQFLQVLLDQELVKIARENLQLQKTQLEQTKAQVEVGSRSPVDEYNQQAQVSNAELRLTQAEFQLISDRTTLLQTLMVDPTLVSSIQEPAWDINTISIDNPDLQQLLQHAETHRSDLKQARYMEQGARLSVRANRGRYLPMLSAFYNNGSAYNQLKGVDKTDPAYRNFDQQFLTDNRSNSYGLSLNIPIFSGFRNRYFTAQSKVLYENSKLLTKNTQVLVKGDVLRAYESFENVKKAYSAGVTGLEASTMAYNLEQERFNLGITSFVDFANANRTYVQAQTDMAQSKYRLLFQKIMLDYALGTLQPDDVP